MNKPILGLYAKDFDRPFNIPERATVGSAGYDLKASFDASFNPIEIPPGERRLIKTNLVVEIQPAKTSIPCLKARPERGAIRP